VSAPAIVITLTLEQRPIVTHSCMYESDELRLRDWIEAHPDLYELIERALQVGDTPSSRAAGGVHWQPQP
jgi:hypothetical protein